MGVLGQRGRPAGTTRSLWGIVTLAPRKSSERSSATASARLIGGRSQQLVVGVDPERIEGGLLHRAGQRMADRMADQDDSLGHARTLSSTAKKPG